MGISFWKKLVGCGVLAVVTTLTVLSQHTCQVGRSCTDHREGLLFGKTRPPGRRCPADGIVTVAEAGRLGNQMWQYAATWATARKTGLQPYVPSSIRTALDRVFRNLSVPSIDELAGCPLHLDSALHSPDQWAHPNQSIVLPMYPFYETMVLRWAEDLRREFSFRDNLLEASRKTLERAGKIVSKVAVTYVGVHVRRTDYSHHLWRRGKAILAGLRFFLNAMKYFRDKYGDGVVFVVVSDDPYWCQLNLAVHRRDVFIVRGSSPEEDLSLMSACNHSLFDYGTFGSWGAFLANGDTVTYNLSIPEETSMIIAPLFTNWHVMS